MTIQLAENIRRLRKENGMMQEQLAEALGVSVGAVSKWERGAATPDLAYIFELASLFGVSTDSLLGFTMQSNTVDAIVERIRDYEVSKDYERGAQEAARALQKYPNDFRIVYRCACFYSRVGVEREPEKNMKKAVSLFEHSLRLFSQNQDASVNEVEIRNNIAFCYLYLDEEKAVELMKRNNVCGINDALIGMTYAKELHKPQESLKYLSGAFLTAMTNLVRTMCGFANAFEEMKQEKKALDAMLWLIGYLDSLWEEDGTATYLDKIRAPFYVQCAAFVQKAGQEEQASAYLEKAYEYARRFDASPVYEVTNLKFAAGVEKGAVAFDDLGDTAVSAVERGLREKNVPEIVREYWEELKNGGEK